MHKIVIALSLILFITTANAQKIPAKAAVLKTMELTNGYFINKWPDTKKDIFVPSKNRSWPSHIWTRAVYYEGLMALSTTLSNSTFVQSLNFCSH